jgi:hypothetical protein
MNEYQADWQQYRRLRRKLLLVWLLYVPGVGLFASASDYLFHTLAPAFAVAMIWMIWFLFANGSFEQFSCPRCRNRFDKGDGAFAARMWLFARKCQHCGLKKFAAS